MSFGKDHDQRPRLGADKIISALSHIQGNCPYCSEIFASTTISPEPENDLSLSGRCLDPEHRLGDLSASEWVRGSRTYRMRFSINQCSTRWPVA
jgi:hypothetical protein